MAIQCLKLKECRANNLNKPLHTAYRMLSIDKFSLNAARLIMLYIQNKFFFYFYQLYSVGEN